MAIIIKDFRNDKNDPNIFQLLWILSKEILKTLITIFSAIGIAIQSIMKK